MRPPPSTSAPTLPGVDAAAVITSADPVTTRSAPATIGRRSQARPSSLLARHAETEYVYVARDIRHIVYVAAAIAAILVVLWVLIDLVHVISY